MNDKSEKRRLTTDYADVLYDEESDVETFFREALVVLDTNVLLALYEIGLEARGEVFNALRLAAKRLWVPHRVALEFSRNRQRVVTDRVRQFDNLRSGLKRAPKDAVSSLESALEGLIQLREKSRTTREWSLEAAGLDAPALAARLDGVMDAALAELALLESEHDVTPVTLRDDDEVLSQIDELLVGKLGRPASSADLERETRHAVSFRYPNKIPPGYLDAGKPSEIDAAGDYLVWREIVEQVLRVGSFDRVLLVTSDVKEDWWVLDKRKRPLRARPELCQELREEAGASLLLRSLSGFLAGARIFLSAKVSDVTVQQVQDTETDVAETLGDSKEIANLLNMSTSDFVSYIYRLFEAMGYEVSWPDILDSRPSFDFLAVDNAGLVPLRVGVECKRYSQVVPTNIIQQVQSALNASPEVDSAVIVTTSRFGRAARENTRSNVRLIAGDELLQLIQEHLGVRARIVLEPPDTIS